MLEIKKFGKTQYGVWVIGILKYKGLEIDSIFQTTLEDTSLLEDKESIEVKKIKISRISKDKSFKITLEF